MGWWLAHVGGGLACVAQDPFGPKDRRTPQMHIFDLVFECSLSAYIVFSIALVFRIQGC